MNPDPTPREALSNLSREVGLTRAIEWTLASPWRWGPITAVGAAGFTYSLIMTLPMLF